MTEVQIMDHHLFSVSAGEKYLGKRYPKSTIPASNVQWLAASADVKG